MTTEVIAGILIVGSILGAGWGANVYLKSEYADNEALTLVGAKVDLLTDARLEALIEQRTKLQEKKMKTPDDRRQIEYLDKQIEYLRKVQRGQIK